MSYQSMKRKLWREQLLMLPFVAAGKLYGKLFPLQSKHRIFLFFPNADIGGSPKVNLDITECVKEYQPVIVFSKKPKNNLFSDRFKNLDVPIIDLHKKIDNKAFHFINLFYRGVVASWIHQQKDAIILGGECIFFYKMLPHLKKSVRRVEVCHLDTWLNYSIGFADSIDARVFSTEQLKRDVENLYRHENLAKSYFHKLMFIENAIDIPPYKTVTNAILQVIFIGRGSPQKRVPLIAAIAKDCHEKRMPVHVSFVGDVENVIDVNNFPFCTFYGNVKDNILLQQLYDESDVLLMTSSFEGLPIVVMEMMARGKVIITTAVNGLPDYIQHHINGFLITATDENDIVTEGVSYIKELITDSSLKEVFGVKSRQLAIERFSYQKFCIEYKTVLHLSS